MEDTPQTFVERFRKLPRSKKVVLVSTIAFVLYTFVGFLILPPIVRITLEKKLPPIVKRSVSVNKVRLNPLTLSASIEGFTIFRSDSETPFVHFDSLRVNLQTASIFRRALIIKSASITAPELSISRIDETTFNFSDLIPPAIKEKPTEEPDSPFLFSINNVEIINGDIQFSDQPKEKDHHIEKLNLAIASISNLPYKLDNYVQPAFSAVINGTPFNLGGQTKPFANSRETDLEIDIANLNIAEYLAYLPNPTQAVLASCLLDIKGNLGFSNNGSPNSSGILSYSGQIIFKNISITNQNNEQFIHLPEVGITLAKSNLLSQHVHLASLTISKPDISIQRTKEQELLPLAFLLPEKSEPNATEENDTVVAGQNVDKGNLFRLDIDNLLLDKGTISFQDDSVNDFSTQISPLTLNITNFSTAEGKTAEFDLQVTTQSSEFIKTAGSFQISPVTKTNGTFSIQDISLPNYMPYAVEFVSPEIVSGSLSLGGSFDLNLPQQGPLDAVLSEIRLSLTNLSVKDKSKQVISIPEIGLGNGRINLAEQSIHFDSISGKDAVFTATKDQQGVINFSSFVKPQKPKPTLDSDEKLDEEADSQEQKTDWVLSVDSINLNNYEFEFSDQSLQETTELRAHDLTLAISNFTTNGPPAKLDLNLQLNKAGTLLTTGNFGLSPLTAKLETTVNKLAFKPFQAYVSEFSNVIVKDGNFSSKGSMSLTHRQNEAPAVTFSGNANIENFSTIDSLMKEDLIKWGSFNISDISFSSEPGSLSIKTIEFTEPFAKIVISEEGSLNLSQIIKKTDQEPSEVSDTPSTAGETSTSNDFQITVNSFSINNGLFSFADKNITPEYSASISEFGGNITGLSSSKEARANVTLEGKLNQFSPLKISGALNPLAEEIFADLKIDFHDIDLSPTSPYTGKHLGYKTDKGKLTLNLHYLVEGKEINAKNAAFLDQFTLGEKVESPDAISAPIHLALALLRNRKGEITLNIPVKGNLDDPEFSIGGVVAKVIFNIITKAVTSPFALLGALIPDGDDLQYISFEPGLANITGDHEQKLSQISSVLYERPGLRMDIIGKVDPVKDKKAIEESRFQKMLKIQKASDQQGFFSQEAPPELSTIAISEEEYPKYLVMAYKAMLDRKDTRSKGAKAWSSFTGFVKGDSPEKNLSQEEMKIQIIEDMSIAEENLRLLAHQRASNVKTYLIETGKVEPERLFVIEPKVATIKEESESEVDLNDLAMQVDLVIK